MRENGIHTRDRETLRRLCDLMEKFDKKLMNTTKNRKKRGGFGSGDDGSICVEFRDSNKFVATGWWRDV